MRFPAIIVGRYENAFRIYKDAEKRLEDGGYYVTGYVAINENENIATQKFLPKLGHLNNLEKIIDETKTDLVVLAIDKTDQPLIEKIISRLSEKDVAIKIQANSLDIISGSVKTSNVLGAVLIDEETLADICERDTRDTTRTDSPLKQAEDAIVIDSTNLTIEEVLEKMLAFKSKIKG